MRYTIYLSGQISLNKQISYDWRRTVREQFLNTNYDVEIIDPCLNTWNQKIVGKRIDTIYTQHVTALLKPKDLHSVKQSNIIIYNANQYDLDKPLIGSLFELAVASEYSDKTVIGIIPKRKPYTYYNHPFILNSVHVWAESEIEVCNIIKEMFF